MSTPSQTQIVATLGPASTAQATISGMLDSGADVIRLNFSHGTYEEHERFIGIVREQAAERGIRIPIIQDLSGPREKTDVGHGFDDSKAEITEKDLADLDFGIAHGVDYIAQSYVGTADDVRALREEIAKRGARTPIIAKIERTVAVEHLDGIIAAADAVMVARGDLGNEEPLGEIPFVEKEIIAKCNATGKPVIVATQMLLSMLHATEPTRAEVTDEVFAIMEGADAVMLSDETANGEHPLEAVRAMETIAERAETHSSRTPNLL